MFFHRQSRLLISLLPRISVTLNQPTNNTPVILKRTVFATQKLCDLKIADFAEVKLAKNNAKIYVIDVREPAEVQETGSIPGSINIPLGNIEAVLSSMSEQEFEKCYGRAKPSKESPLIFSCKIGKRSGTAQEIATKLGYNNVKIYLGSWTDWVEKNK